MPLYKRKPCNLVELPKDLKPMELVYQVRFTKEIFRDYQAYLHRINLYRRRLWNCKVTGKSNLTYEEALVSEKRALEKVQQFPEQLMAPMLSIIQYSMLSLKDLADAIALKLQEFVFEGIELYGRKENGVFPCRIMKIMKDSAEKMKYEIAWLGKDREVVGNSLVNDEDLIRKKFPYSRNMVKSFIRESTFRSAPWVIHDRLAKKHGISANIPDELKSKFFLQNGALISYRKKRKNGETQDGDESGKDDKNKRIKREKVGDPSLEVKSEKEDDRTMLETIRYPIEDLLVQPGPDDPVFVERPSPSRDFKVPVDCVGDLLMVWDFCSSFSRLLHLWPFSFEDFENAVCHKDSNLNLMVECHSALLRLLIKDNGEYASTMQKRRRKSKITLITWAEYLCDFLDMTDSHTLSTYIATIKRGHYGLLDPHAKLEILQELLNYVLETDIIREQLDEYIEQWHELGATRRGEALEEARKRREEKERFKAESEVNGLMNGHSSNSSENNHGQLVSDAHCKQNEETELEKGNISKKREGRKKTKKQNALENGRHEDVQDLSKREVGKIAQKHMGTDEREEIGKMSKEQRKQHYEKEMEKRFIRTNPLGKDRHHNRYWWFRRDGRIFIESSDHKVWGYYCTKEELDALMGSLNRKGERERALQKQLDNYYNRICLELQKRSKKLADKIAMEEAVLRRSTRVRAPPRDNPANAFLQYVNKWKED